MAGFYAWTAASVSATLSYAADRRPDGAVRAGHGARHLRAGRLDSITGAVSRRQAPCRAGGQRRHPPARRHPGRGGDRQRVRLRPPAHWLNGTLPARCPGGSGPGAPVGGRAVPAVSGQASAAGTPPSARPSTWPPPTPSCMASASAAWSPGGVAAAGAVVPPAGVPRRLQPLVGLAGAWGQPQAALARRRCRALPGRWGGGARVCAPCPRRPG